MRGGQPPQVECKWCGAKVPATQAACPYCGQALSRAGLPLDTGGRESPARRAGRSGARPPFLGRRTPRSQEVEPLPPAPGQEVFGSWGNIKEIVRHDPLLGAVLAMLSMDVLLQIVSQAWIDALVTGAVLWGVLTFRTWGYWLAMLGAGLGFLAGLLLLALGAGTSRLGALVMVGICGFVAVVLFARRDCFD